jgi:DNA-3-methyladenine glycosylase I
VPLHDDRRLFEILILEGAQAGLSWMILHRLRAYPVGLRSIHARKIARYDRRKSGRALNPGIVRIA